MQTVDPVFMASLALILGFVSFFYMVWYTMKGPAGQLTNALTDEEAMQGLISKLIRGFQFSLMGQASGDAKKSAKAKTLVSEAIVEKVLPTINPLLGLVVNHTELGDWLTDDPDNTGAVIGVLTEWFGKADQKGLGNLLESFLGTQAGVLGQQTQPDRQVF